METSIAFLPDTVAVAGDIVAAGNYVVVVVAAAVVVAVVVVNVRAVD
jgi:hypothetical protein